MQLFRKTQSVIGLDIGSSFIKAVKMTLKGKNYTLEKYHIEPVEEGAWQSGEVKNPTSLAKSAIKAVSSCDPNIKDVIIALPNYSILSNVLNMDLMPEKEIKQAVHVEAQRISPFDISELEIDFAVLEKNEEKKMMKVLLVAAKNDIILSLIDCMNEAGLRPVVIDIDLFAVINLFQLNYDINKYNSSIIINIGTETTDAAFIHNGIFHSSRDIPISGTNFRTQLGFATSLPPDQINNIINSKIDPKIDTVPIVNALNTVSKEFANAVGVAVSYFQTSDSIDKIDLIVLSGGYAHVPGLLNMLELRTGAEVEILDPLKNIVLDEKIALNFQDPGLGSVLSVAMGLATRTY
jgi:type IV pilus assembly protein PilM